MKSTNGEALDEATKAVW